MGEFPNKATQFTSENQPANKGRKKNKFTYLKEDTELSQNDFENIINNLSNMTVEEFDLMTKDKTKARQMPMIYYKLMEAYAGAKLDDIIKLMKAAGKAPDKAEVKISEIPTIIIKRSSE